MASVRASREEGAVTPWELRRPIEHVGGRREVGRRLTWQLRGHGIEKKGEEHMRMYAHAHMQTHARKHTQTYPQTPRPDVALRYSIGNAAYLARTHSNSSNESLNIRSD